MTKTNLGSKCLRIFVHFLNSLFHFAVFDVIMPPKRTRAPAKSKATQADTKQEVAPSLDDFASSDAPVDEPVVEIKNTKKGKKVKFDQKANMSPSSDDNPSEQENGDVVEEAPEPVPEPKKRGRKAKGQTVEAPVDSDNQTPVNDMQQEESEAAANPPLKKRPGRKVKAVPAEETEKAKSASPQAKRGKRTKADKIETMPSSSKLIEPHTEQEPAEADLAVETKPGPKKRTRKPKATTKKVATSKEDSQQESADAEAATIFNPEPEPEVAAKTAKKRPGRNAKVALVVAHNSDQNSENNPMEEELDEDAATIAENIPKPKRGQRVAAKAKTVAAPSLNLSEESEEESSPPKVAKKGRKAATSKPVKAAVDPPSNADSHNLSEESEEESSPPKGAKKGRKAPASKPAKAAAVKGVLKRGRKPKAIEDEAAPAPVAADDAGEEEPVEDVAKPAPQKRARKAKATKQFSPE